MSRPSHSSPMLTLGSCLRRRFSLAGFGFLCLLTGAWVCSAQTPKPLLEHYDLSPDAGHEAKLPRALEEVSGLATTPDGRLFAHDDERAIVYQVDPENGEILKAFSVGAMGIPGDFEGIAVAGERFFLVTSAGQIVEFQEGASDSSVGYRIHSLGLGNLCEMEGLAFDEAAGALLMPCKNPRARSLQGHLVVYSVPLNTMKPDQTPRVFLPLRELAAWGLGDEFHPSAIEVHPQTGSLILVSASEEAIVELSPLGKILGTKKLKAKDHPQPEGVAFLPDGTLILADEGQGKRGTITLYHRMESEGVGDDDSRN
ncbi:MAG: SdiA-regulated domain-containing protein [Longimicrobiales bacterium]|nr:SdiA-regulated domain-containing protein [Longimicrobiales bacterium]